MAASSFIVSARSSTNTRNAGLERRVRGGGDDRLVDVAPQHLVRAARRDPGEVGVRAVQRARARAVRVGGAAREQLGGDGARRGALAAPGRAVQQVRVRGPPAGGRAEHGGGVRVGLEGGEGHGDEASGVRRRGRLARRGRYRPPTCSAAA